MTVKQAIERKEEQISNLEQSLHNSEHAMANPDELSNKKENLDQALREKKVLDIVAEHAERTNTTDYKSNLEQVAQDLQGQLSLAERSKDSSFAAVLWGHLSACDNLKNSLHSSSSSLIDDFSDPSTEPMEYTGGDD